MTSKKKMYTYAEKYKRKRPHELSKKKYSEKDNFDKEVKKRDY